MMKKHGLKLTLLLLVGLAISCTGEISDHEAILTKGNFIYKEYMDNVHYSNALKTIDEKIDSLNLVLSKNPNDSKAVIEKATAEAERVVVNEKIEKYTSLQFYGIIGPIGPCDVGHDLCLPPLENLKFLVVLANSQVALNTSKVQISVYNDKNILISKMGDAFSPLPENAKNIAYTDFNLTSNYSGTATVNVVEKSLKGEVLLDYTLTAYIPEKLD